MNTKKEELDPKERLLITRIAHVYWVEGKKNQRKIAESPEFKNESHPLTQARISHYLEIAEQYGIVKHIVEHPNTKDLANKLKVQFPHLQDVYVVPYADSPEEDRIDLLNLLGREGAKRALEIINHSDKIGVSCGRSISYLIDGLAYLNRGGKTTDFPVNCRIYPLMILMSPEIGGVTPTALVSDFVRWLPASVGQGFQLPPDPKGSYRNHEEIRKLIEVIQNLQHYFIGVGLIDFAHHKRKSTNFPTHEFTEFVERLDLFEELKGLDATAECIHQPIGSKGALLIDRPELKKLKDNLLYLDLKVLQKHVADRSANVFCVAGGYHKRNALISALKAKLFNILVVDSGTVEHILNEKP